MDSVDKLLCTRRTNASKTLEKYNFHVSIQKYRNTTYLYSPKNTTSKHHATNKEKTKSLCIIFSYTPQKLTLATPKPPPGIVLDAVLRSPGAISGGAKARRALQKPSRPPLLPVPVYVLYRKSLLQKLCAFVRRPAPQLIHRS